MAAATSPGSQSQLQGNGEGFPGQAGEFHGGEGQVFYINVCMYIYYVYVYVCICISMYVYTHLK